MTDLEHCSGRKTSGEPCEVTWALDEHGLCQAHREGGLDRMRDMASRGGEALKQKYAGAAFTADELAPILTLDDAMRRLDVIQSAVLTRRISHAEGNAASKVIDSWVKAHASHLTAGLVNELRAELDKKTREIESLRKQLSGSARVIRKAS